MARKAFVLVVVLLAAAPVAAAQARVVATEQGRIHADTWNDRIAWSAFDAQARVWRLATIEDGQVVRADVPGATHPLRLDVGPGPKGRPVAVYPRCETGGSCDVHLYDFARRRERKLRRISTRAASESVASIWRGRIAFARREGGISTIHVSDLDGKRASVVPGGEQTQPAGPTALELRGTRLTFLWSRLGDLGFTETSLWIWSGGRLRMLDRTESTAEGAASFVTPEIHGRHVYYARTDAASRRGNQLRRAHVRTRRVRYAMPPFRGLAGAVWMGDRFLLSRAWGEGSADPESECRPPGSAPADTRCRLVIGEPVDRWRRPADGAR